MKLKTFSTALAVTALGLATTGAYAQTPAPATPAPSPTELVYTPQLPSVAALMSAAKAQGMAVIKIDQTSNEINAVYRDANGYVTTVSYQVLPAGGEVPAAAPGTAPAPGTTTVVYQAPPAGYYASYPYPYYAGYYPWGWYAPIGIGIGFGWHGGGWHGGGWRR